MRYFDVRYLVFYQITTGKGRWDLPRVVEAGVSAAAAIILRLPGPKTAIFAC